MCKRLRFCAEAVAEETLTNSNKLAHAAVKSKRIASFVSSGSIGPDPADVGFRERVNLQHHGARGYRAAGSIPDFLIAAMAAGDVMNFIHSLAASTFVAPVWMPPANVVTSWMSGGRGPR